MREIQLNINVISAGAAMGLVRSLEASFRGATGLGITGTFGAVGAMSEKLALGAPCDVIILTDRQIRALHAEGKVQASKIAILGCVPTAIAVCAGCPKPSIKDQTTLRATLVASSAVYLPDPMRATAGIHFASVLKALGVHPPLRPFPNGAEAMRALALSQDRSAIGCTQASEILYTEGVTLVGPLPEEVGLVTAYAAAVTKDAPNPQAARTLVELLSSPRTARIREAAGFGQSFSGDNH